MKIQSLSGVESGEQLDIGEADRRGIVYALQVLPCRTRAGYPFRGHGAEEPLHEVLCTVSISGLVFPLAVTGLKTGAKGLFVMLSKAAEDQGVKSGAIGRIGEDENRFEDDAGPVACSGILIAIRT